MVRKPGTRKPLILEAGGTSPVPPSRVRGIPPEPSPQPVSGERPLCPRCKHESDSAVDFCSRCGFSFRETRSVEEHAAVRDGLLGQVINKKYKVLSILGEGGFGVVYKAELLLLDTGNVFALKLLHPALSKDQNFRRRFLREVGMAMALIHENTIQIREFGQTEDGQLFFTMDYCVGEPLKVVIAREGFLNVNRALHVARQMLSVMKLAHSRGIIHRDIKPENIFLEKDAQGRDFVKVGDFGLAKSFAPVELGGRMWPLGRGAGSPLPSSPAVPGGRRHSEDLSRGAILGTPRYMSPEQALGSEDLDDRSDVYSIGVVLYEMIYGQVPAERASVEAPGRLRTPTPHAGHSVPGPVWDVVRKALEVQRANRFQSAEEFLQALNALPHYTPSYAEPAPVPSPGGGWRGRLVRLLVVLLLLGSGAGSYFAWQQGLFGGKDPDDDREMAYPESIERGSVPESAGLNARFPRDIAAFFSSFREGARLRYMCYRGGVLAQELVYEIVEESTPGRFLVERPGESSPEDTGFYWTVDKEKNSFYAEFPLPDPKTGSLTETEPQRRLLFCIPKDEAILDEDSSYIPNPDLRIQLERVTLNTPREHPTPFGFTDCVRVESRTEGQVHYRYFQEGNGEVGIEVYEVGEAPGSLPEKGDVPTYARYLIKHPTGARARGDQHVGPGDRR